MHRLPAFALFLVTACVGPRVVAHVEGDLVQVLCDGAPFAVVHRAATPRPFVFPVLGPGQLPLTRSFPMADVVGETKDHPHHQSMWFAHGDVNGYDFWQGRDRRERIEWDGSGEVESNASGARIRCGYRWLVDDDTLVVSEEREWIFGATDGARTIDVTVTLRATAGPVVLGDTKEGTFAVRVQQGLVVDGDGATGRLSNSEGRAGASVWGQRARWIDDTGVVDGSEAGIALFDHPHNHAHPTYWHARTYGLLAANPFGAHDFAKRPPGEGALTIPLGGSLRLHYRVLLHGAGWDRARIEAAYGRWVAP